MAKYISLFIVFIFLIGLDTKAQTEGRVDSSEVYFVVDEMPQYPGGEQELQKYIATNFKCPDLSKIDGIKGKLYVRFAVMPDGHVDSVRVCRPVYPSLDAEGIRVIQSLPRWMPGRMKGVRVAVWYTLPFNDLCWQW